MNLKLNFSVVALIKQELTPSHGCSHVKVKEMGANHIITPIIRIVSRALKKIIY